MWAGLPFLLMALPLLGGVALIATGLRGRRVGEHPHCRACGFDLIGLPKDAQRCSECGADVSTPRAIVIGQRVRFRARIAVGAILLLLLATVGYVASRGANFNPHKPTWWLKIEAQYASDETADAALVEIVNRVRAKQLGDDALASLVDIALARQTGPAKKWRGGWADVVEVARGTGKLSDERWAQYARNAIVNAVRFDIRPRVTRGDVIPWRVSFGGPGWRGSNGSSGGMLRCVFNGVEFDGPLFEGRRDQRFRLMFNGGMGMSSAGHYIEPTADDLAPIPDGAHEVEAVAQVDVADSSGSQLQLKLPMRATYTLIPATESSAVEQPDASLLGAIKSSLKISQAQLRPTSDEMWLNVTLTSQSVPANLAMDVTARVHGTDKSTSMRWLTIASPKDGTMATMMTSLTGKVSDEFLNALHAANDRIDLVMQPSRRAAANTIDIDKFWSSDQPVVIEDIQVADPKSATSAGTMSTTQPSGPR